MLARNININNFDEAFNSVEVESDSASRVRAFKLGKSDYDFNQETKNKLFNPYPEDSPEYTAYEYAYTRQELKNFKGNH